MRKYKSGLEKSRREAEDKLKKVAANSKKVTDFFDVSESIEKQQRRNDVQYVQIDTN